MSFAEHETELLEFFDKNGKSDIAKEAMDFYKKNKDKISIDTLLSLIRNTNVNNAPIQSNQNFKDKFAKLRK